MSVMKYLVAALTWPVLPLVNGRIVIDWSVVTLKFAPRNTPIAHFMPTAQTIGLAAPAVSPAMTFDTLRKLLLAAAGQSTELLPLSIRRKSEPEAQVVLPVPWPIIANFDAEVSAAPVFEPRQVPRSKLPPLAPLQDW